MIEVKPPSALPNGDKIKIFLAGSIEMGVAEQWQSKVVERLQAEDVIIFNPRRESWDASWVQSIDNPQFKQQVEWELDALEISDYIILYLDPDTKSPISLFEMGLFARSKKMFIVCPGGFWRKGNVDIVAEKYGIPQFSSLDALLENLATVLSRRNVK